MAGLKCESAVRSPLVNRKFWKSLYGFLIFLIVTSSVLSGCQKMDFASRYSENTQLKEWFQKSSGAFVGAIRFNGGNIRATGNGKIKAEIPVVGKWAFNLAKAGKSKNLSWIEVPLHFEDSKQAMVENISIGANGLEADFTKTYLIVYTDSRKGDTNYIVKMLSARLPVESNMKKRALSTTPIREIFYSASGSILADYDVLGNERKRYKTSMPGSQGSRLVEKKALTCTVTSTKYSECTVDANYNSVCTFYTVSLTRCVYSGDGDPNGNYTNNAFLEEGLGSGGGGSEFEEVKLQNQKFIDSLNGYPCAQNVLASVGNLEDEISILIRNAFMVDPKIKLQFGVDSTLIGSATNGHTGTSFYDSDGNRTFFVFLNPDILQFATTEFIYSVFIHEGLHAWFDYERRRIGDQLFKERYPNVIEFKDSGERDHHYFSTIFINSIKNSILAFNPNLDAITARGLSWRGLHETAAYLVLPPDSQNIYSQIWWRERNTRDIQSYGTYKGKKCTY
jgi:hypothetical protein